MDEQYTYSRFMKVTSLTVLVAFTMMLLEPTVVAAQVLYDDYQEVLAESAREEAKKLEATLQTVESQLQGWQNSGSRQTRSDLQSDVVKLKRQVQQFDKSVLADFDNTLQHLQDQQLPDVIIQRHIDTVSEYQANMNTLLANLDSLINAENEAAMNAQLETTLQHLQPLLAQGHHPEFDPNNLPFNIPNADNTRAPLEDTSALKSLFPQERQVRSSNTPSNNDLAATEDVQITPAIEELAESLEHNPVKIYNWVHDNIQYIPTHGSIQGSQLTLDNGAGNAVDTASLLIALLRASGVHARYAYGTVRIPVEQAMNWVGGVTAPEAAVQLLAQGGIPSVTSQTQQGKITHVKMEHVWVEAWVDFEPSRGAKHKTGDTWVAMDASFKQYEFTEGMDLQNQVEFDAEGFVNQITDSAEINEAEGWVSGVDQNFMQTQLTDYQAQVEEYVTQTNPDATVGEVLGTQTIIAANRPTLAASLPYGVLSQGSTFNELPADLRHRFEFSLYANESDRVLDNPLFKLSESLPNMAGKRLTLSFDPATEHDREIIESYLPEAQQGQELDIQDLPTSLPGYLIRLKAQLKLDGELVAESRGFMMGQELSSTTKISKVTGGWNTGHNKPLVGEFYAFGIDLQGVSGQQLEDVKQRMSAVKTQLEEQQFDGLTKEDIVGDMLYTGALNYFTENNKNLKILNKGNALAYRLPSFGTFSTSLSSTYSFGVPRKVSMIGIRVDMDTVAQSLWSKDNDTQIVKGFGQQIGMTTSALEHEIPELLFANGETVEGVSAVKALAIASAEGQRIYQITKNNIDTALPQLTISNDIKEEIRDSVLVGKEATISQENITVGNWAGVGYIITDPETGSGAYRISGGSNGGDFLKEEDPSIFLAGIDSLISILFPSAMADEMDIIQKANDKNNCYNDLDAELWSAMKASVSVAVLSGYFYALGLLGPLLIYIFALILIGMILSILYKSVRLKCIQI